MLQSIEQELAELESAGLRRELRTRSGASGRTLTLNGEELLNFASNDYLGFAHRLANDAARYSVPDVGATASRLVCGNHEIHEELERRLGRLHGGLPTLLFSSGYAANVGVLPALASEPDDLIVSDSLNHASIIDGCRLAQARVAVFPHGDLAAAAKLLAGPGRRKFLVSESVFSMDGDHANLDELAEIAQGQGALLIIDQAHAVGWAGERGEGLPLATPEQHLQIATLGKSFGAAGAYVIAPAPIRSLLIHRARSFVFSTGPALPTIQASLGALDLLNSSAGADARAALQRRISDLAGALQELGMLRSGAGRSPIFPIIAGDNRLAMAWSKALWKAGIFVQGIRPPTVPRGTARLRVTLSAAHTPQDIDALVAAIAALPKEL